MASLMFISTAISHIGVVDILTDGVYVRVCECVGACVCGRTHAWVCVLVCMCMCVCLCVCMATSCSLHQVCVCVCICVCMYMRIVLHCFFLYVWTDFCHPNRKEKAVWHCKTNVHVYACLCLSINVCACQIHTVITCSTYSDHMQYMQ